MMTGAKPMQWGGCGGADFRLFTADAEVRIAVECQQGRVVYPAIASEARD
jgi:hypothetical protein